MELDDTNRSRLDFKLGEQETDWKKQVRRRFSKTLCGCQSAGARKITHSGGDNEGVTPVPIPNTEVKPFSADGT